MITNYKPAQVADVAASGDFICGLKFWADTFDAITGEYGTVYFIWLDSIDTKEVRPHSVEHTD